MIKRFPCITLPTRADLVYQDGRFVMVIPVKPDAHYVCRWCFGRPMPGCDVCSRVQCISAVQAVDALDTMTWRGE